MDDPALPQLNICQYLYEKSVRKESKKSDSEWNVWNNNNLIILIYFNK